MKVLRAFLFLAALLFLGVGIILGEPANAMMNAVMICLSCIGVG